jgi:CDP-paratose 2-epimerase
VAHFALSAVTGLPITIFGDGKQVRDILYVGDLVRAFELAEAQAARFAGEAFNIGGGPANAVSLLDVIDILRDVRGDVPTRRHEGWRPGDQRYYVSDTSRFRACTGWTPEIAPREGIKALHDWLIGDSQTAPVVA